MEGRNYLEQLQFKKQAKKPPTINLDFGNKTNKTNKTDKTDKGNNKEKGEKAKPRELEEGEEPEEEGEIVEAPAVAEKRKEIQMKDLRGKVPVDYELIMKRLQTHHITGVVDMVSKKPGVMTSNAAITIPKPVSPKPVITKTAAKAVIEDDEPISLEVFSDKGSVNASDIFGPLSDIDSESPPVPVPAPEPATESAKEPAEKPAAPKKKIVIKGKIDLPGPAKPADEAPAAALEPAKKGKPRGRQTKKASTAVANIKLTKAEITRRLPKTEKLAVRTSQYYMNNRKMYVHKIRELFKPYEKELEEMGEIASCAKDPSVDFSLLTHQKIVRDYLNLFTPYRGLLLYHGLGSGKTCTSIGIAEGMKSAKEIVVMTPASLATNFFTEIKKCGDVLYRKNQFWEFVGIEGQPDNVELLSKALSLPASFIEKKQGAWLVDVKKPPNFKDLTTAEQESIDDQLDKMIRSKYTDIHYNGINRRVMNEITQNNTINPFDNKTVIIDEVHNFVSRIINKLDSKKTDLISKELYGYLLKANNARVVALSGTPIINSPHELSVLFNILRGAIRTWNIPVRHKEGKKISKEDILDMLNNPPAGIPLVTEYDYVEFADNKIIITRNPIGFVNTKRREAKGKAAGGYSESVGILGNIFGGNGNLFGGKKQTKRTIEKTKPQHKKATKKNRPTHKDDDYSAYEIVDGVLIIKDVPKEPISENEDIDFFQRSGHDLHKEGGAKDEFEKYAGVKLDESGNISDDQFLDAIKRILRANEIEVLERMMKDQPVYNTALPDNEDEFDLKFIDEANTTIANPNVFKRRILGLTSYFRSAQESLLPRFEMNGDKTFHIEKVEMSEHQLDEYTYRRLDEIEEKKKRAKTQNRQPREGEEEKKENSTYRVWTREICNFTFPDGIVRPIPDRKHKKDKEGEGDEAASAKKKGGDPDSESEGTESISLDPIDEIESAKDSKYMDRIKIVLKQLAYDPAKPKAEQYLTKEGMLSSLSPKLLKMMENIQNPENEGLHLVYSQFRHIEGIGILKLILEANGYAEFKIKSVGGAESWELVENEEDAGKPMFALYTGTESEEEKEIIRNIYNGDWGFVPKSIVDKLEKISKNNLYGEIIKVLMITAAGAEGINLRNTRFVHITEPYWHNTRLEQVIGRARRICSHEQLPEELRTIKVFLYITAFGEELMAKVNDTIQTTDIDPYDVTHIETTDEYLMRIANDKEKLNKSFLKAIKESSMDCTLYKNKEGLMCYGVGMDKNPGNQFLSYPLVDQDLAEREDLNVKKTALKLAELKIEIRGVKYAIDKATDNLYDLAKYKNGNIELVGKLVRPGKGKTGYDIQFVRK
jgi:hypothetical protein